MDEQVTETTTESAAPVVTETQVEKPAEQPKAKSGYDQIDFSTASPDEIKERFGHLYKQVKAQDRKIPQIEKNLRQYQDIAERQSAEIERLAGGIGKVVNHLEAKNFDTAEASIEKDMNEAFAKGDSKGYLAAQRKMINVLAEKQVRTLTQAQQQQQNPQQRQAQTATQLADRGYGNDSDESRITSAWQDERDDGGQPLRPWAFNNSRDPNNPDQQYVEALTEARAVFTNKRFANMSHEQKLAEVDRRMGVKKTEPAQNVMGGNLTNGKKPSNVRLSPEIERMVTRTKWGGSKFKTDDERLAGYRKQIESVRSQQGSRR